MFEQIAQVASGGAGEYRWVESIVGALIGGSATAWASWIRMGRIVASLKTDHENTKISVAKCQAEREPCRSSVHEHRENSDVHVSGSLTTRIDDIISRLERIESKLME